MDRIIQVIAERCVGCHSCEIACAVAHSASKTLLEASGEDAAQSRVHVEYVDDHPVPIQCRHCEAAPCILVCPTDAIRRVAEPVPVLLDPEACTGCTFCRHVCPFGVVDLPRQGKKPLIKCDLCVDRVEAGELPACVEACPTGALIFAPLDEALREERRQGDQRVAESNARHATEQAGEDKKIHCEVCGEDVAPRKMLETLRGKVPEDVPLANVCPRCRRAGAVALLWAQPAGCAAAKDAALPDATET